MARKKGSGRRTERMTRMKREKPPVHKDTYTTADLKERYGCAQVTIRRKETTEGFPHGEKFGRKVIYSKAAVHAWERIHMPWLHKEADESEDDREWSLMHRERMLEKERMQASEKDPDDDNDKPTGSEKSKRRKGR